MAITINSINTDKVLVGDKDIQSIYVGSKKVWDKPVTPEADNPSES